MSEKLFSILLSTYGIIMPILIGFLLKSISKMNKQKQKHQKDIQDNIEKLEEDVKVLSEKVDSLNKDVVEGHAMASRYRIIRFSDEIYNGVGHSQDHYDQLLVDIDIYEQFCNSHPDFINNKGKRAVKNIRDSYDECMKEHSFIDGISQQ